MKTKSSMRTARVSLLFCFHCWCVVGGCLHISILDLANSLSWWHLGKLSHITIFASCVSDDVWAWAWAWAHECLSVCVRFFFFSHSKAICIYTEKSYILNLCLLGICESGLAISMEYNRVISLCLCISFCFYTSSFSQISIFYIHNLRCYQIYEQFRQKVYALFILMVQTVGTTRQSNKWKIYKQIG